VTQCVCSVLRVFARGVRFAGSPRVAGAWLTVGQGPPYVLAM
jgi:hypothetical protein